MKFTWTTFFLLCSLAAANKAPSWTAPPQTPEYPFKDRHAATNFVITICKGLLTSQFNCSDTAGLDYFAANLLSGNTVSGHILQSVAFYATPVDSPSDPSPGIPLAMLPNRNYPRKLPIQTVIYTPNMVNTFLAYRVDVLYRSILGWPQADQKAINYWVNALRNGVVSVDWMMMSLCGEGYGPRAGCAPIIRPLSLPTSVPTPVRIVPPER